MTRSLPDLVALLRCRYHLNAIDINNVLNQLGLRSNDKAEECAKNHVMTLWNDILPRLGYNTKEILTKD